jgi:hypothetical protein
MSKRAEDDFESRLPDEKSMFSVRWIAGYLGVSINHVNNLIDSGAIKMAIDARGNGSTKTMRRVHRIDLVRFLNSRKDA